MEENEKIIEIELERLKDFPNHPFKVQDDQQMTELTKSIKKYGILNPLIVRPVPDGTYEIISGHRRRHAAQILGYRRLDWREHVLDTGRDCSGSVWSDIRTGKAAGYT